jgi:threonine/homoserine/homoserine lactone efflux protein
MFATDDLLIFMTAAMALLIVPGPAVLYIVTRSVDQGRTAGIVSALGIGVGSLFHVAAAALGIFVLLVCFGLLVSSTVAFKGVKYMGAAYLIYLGVRKLRETPTIANGFIVEHRPLHWIFSQSVVIKALNLHSALFFFAFLPQFVNASQGSVSVQILVLGLLFTVMAICSDSVYALLAGTIGDWLKRNVQFQQVMLYFSGAIYIGFGVTFG